MKIVGIDPGLKTTALVHLDFTPPEPGVLTTMAKIHGALRVLAHQTIRSSASEDVGRRLSRIFDNVQRFLLAASGGLDAIALEDPAESFARGDTRVVMRLGSAFGAALLGAERANLAVPVTLVPISKWIPRKYIPGVGPRSMKHKDMRAQLRDRYPALNNLNDDETFASGVAIWHANEQLRGPLPPSAA